MKNKKIKCDIYTRVSTTELLESALGCSEERRKSE